MQCGKYNLESLNNGKYSIRWHDKDTDKWCKHIILNIEEVFNKVVKDSIQYHYDKVFESFSLCRTSLYDFLDSPDVEWVDSRILIREPPYNDLHSQFQAFVKCYNKKFDTIVNADSMLDQVIQMNENLNKKLEEESKKVESKNTVTLEDYAFTVIEGQKVLVLKKSLDNQVTDGYSDGVPEARREK